MMCRGIFLVKIAHYTTSLLNISFVFVRSIEMITIIIELDLYLDSLATTAEYTDLVRDIRSSPLGTKFFDACVRKLIEYHNDDASASVKRLYKK